MRKRWYSLEADRGERTFPKRLECSQRDRYRCFLHISVPSDDQEARALAALPMRNLC
jgi:hypothetical protein